MLQILDVAKTYLSEEGRETVALQPTTLSISEGEFVTLVGPSGCGKTTLLKLIAGLLQPSSGTVRFREEDRIPAEQIGMVFQQPALLPWRRILHNLLLPAQVLERDLAAARQRALELLREVGIEDFHDRYPHQLSGGMQQRAGVARALVHNPAVLLMDEPFAALDALTRETLGRMLESIHVKERKTTVFVTHSIPEAAALSDRVVVLSPGPGRIVDVVEVEVPRPRRLDDPQVAAALATAESKIRGLMGTEEVAA